MLYQIVKAFFNICLSKLYIRVASALPLQVDDNSMFDIWEFQPRYPGYGKKPDPARLEVAERAAKKTV